MTSVLASRYTLDELIATGGMGEVWRATDSVLERTVALKILRFPGGDVARERFRREALAAAAVSNPAVAHIHDFVDDPARPAIVMEYVAGETLAARLRRGRLSADATARIGAAVCSALEAAHDAGIVHRDIKPGNIMIATDGRVKVTDFGIARTAGDETLTSAGQVLGTPHYLAPEQVRGEPAGPAADIYSLGAVMYECLTGRPPFEGDSPASTALARLSRDPVAPRAIDPAIPVWIGDITMRALERTPADRFASAEAMRAALTAVAPAEESDPTVPLAGSPREGPPTQVLSTAELPVARSRRFLTVAHPRRIAVAGIALLSAIALVVVALLAAAGRKAPPPCCTVPHITTLAQAPTLLRRAGLRYGGVIERTEKGFGSLALLGLEPASGTSVPKGTAVRVIINCCAVPNVDSAGTARSVLASAGLALGQIIETTASGDIPAGTVLRTSPAEGTLVPRGTKVDIVVAAQQSDEHGKKKHGGGKD